ncbi:phosphopantetheine-binding protein, partial [Streptomyces sp. NRRL S-1896]|uniref:phosphopantetheine-binding protein n=1 Tax=Streptomyces sp. NRRL S-1896 TaxID=1463893 RepID=UPI00056B8B35
GMSDHVIMVKERAKVFLGGAPLVKMANGGGSDDELRALAERAAQQEVGQRGEATGDSALTALVDIFAAALPGATVDADTDFFAAGGDSIVAITVINRARARDLPIAPRDVFLLKTPRALADHLATRAPQ